MNLDSLKDYTQNRNILFLRSYGQISPYVKCNLDPSKRHPNTLRFLDRQSQLLIRAVNLSEGYTLLDKVFTSVMYRSIGCYKTILTMSDDNNMFKYEDAFYLRARLNRKEVKYQGFETPLSYTLGDFGTGDIALHYANCVMSNLPNDLFKGWRLSHVCKHIKKHDTSKVLQSNIIMQYALDLSYIDELGIILDEFFGYGLPRSIDQANKGDVLKFLEWYKENYLFPPLSLITYQDVLHICYGHLSNKQVKDFEVKYYKTTEKNLEDIIIPLSIRSLHESLHNKTNG